MRFQKSKVEILQKTTPYHTNPRIKYNTFLPSPSLPQQIKTIPKTIISPKLKPWFTEKCKNIRETSSNSQEIQDKPLIGKPKQIQTTKGKKPNISSKKLKDPPGEPCLRRQILIQIQKYWEFLNKNYNQKHQRTNKSPLLRKTQKATNEKHITNPDCRSSVIYKKLLKSIQLNRNQRI